MKREEELKKYYKEIIKDLIKRLEKHFKEKYNIIINNSVLNEHFIKKIEEILTKNLNKDIKEKDFFKVFYFNSSLYSNCIKEATKELEKYGITEKILKDNEIKEIINKSLEDYKNKLKKETLDKNEENTKNKITRLNVNDLPRFMEEDFIRILNYSGYDLIRDNDYYVAVNKYTGKHEKIMFFEDNNYCYFESNPNNKIFINISLSNNDYELGCECISIINDIEIYFHEDKKDLIIRNSSASISYRLSVTHNNEINIIKTHNNVMISDTYDNIIDEIEKIVPGIINEFIKEHGIKSINKNNITMTNEENKNKEIFKNEENIDDLDEIHRQEFYKALEIQKIKDIEDAQRRIQKSNGLILDKEVA